MNNRHTFILTLLAAVLLALPARAYDGAAFAALPLDGALSGVTTVVTDTQGARHVLDGALDLAALEQRPDAAAKIASCALMYGGEELLGVTLHGFEPDDGALSLLGEVRQIANGYCVVTFTYDDVEASAFAGREACLTGLKLAQVGELGAKLTGAALGYQTFDLSDLSFVDAEKLATVPADDAAAYGGDSELCWAATTANLLELTGWGRKADADRFQSEDDLMDFFAANFTDGAGSVRYGLEWFFNGRYYPAEIGAAEWSQHDGMDAGGYLRYPIELYMEKYDDPAADIDKVAQKLREGCGAAISMGWYEDGVRDGGHALTLAGYVRAARADGRYEKSDYVALLIADSDSDPSMMMDTASDQRTDAPDVLCMMPMTPCAVSALDEQGRVVTSSSWWLRATETKEGLLEDFTLLAPYSDALPEDGVCDDRVAPDLVVRELYVSDCAEDLPFFSDREAGVPAMGELRRVFAAGGEFSVTPQLWNQSAVTYAAGSAGYAVRLFKGTEEIALSAPGDVCKFNGGALGGYGLSNASSSGRVSLGCLEPGEYTVRVTVAVPTAAQREAGLDEAYYYNNTAETTFTVTAAPADLGGATVAAGVMTSLGTDGQGNSRYTLPLTIKVDASRAAAYYVAVSQMWGTDAGGEEVWSEWADVYACSPSDTSLTLGLYSCYRVRVRVMLQPKAADQAWQVVEKIVTLRDRELMDGDYAMFEVDRRQNSLTLFCGRGSNMLLVMGYDEKGFMVSLAVYDGLTDGYENGWTNKTAPLDPGAVTFKAFVIDRATMRPQCAAVTMHAVK